MHVSLDRIAAVATLAGTALALLAVVQSSEWMVLISLSFITLSVGVGMYARQKRLILASASMVIEGHSIDSLNVANLRRRVNRTFVVQEAHHTVRIEGEDMKITWNYSGYCRADFTSAMEFSIDSDEGTPFDKLDCEAFDLAHDPEMRHKIRPVLVGTEGISKKVSVPFLEPLKADQPFGVILKCTLPRCVKMGFGYYTATSSFAQARVQRCTVRLIFVGAAPVWLRVYESTAREPAALVKTLPPILHGEGLCEYLDIVGERHGRSARVYAFWR